MSAIVHTTGAVSVTNVGDDAYRIDCARCGEKVTYRFLSFTSVEADRTKTTRSQSSTTPNEIAARRGATA